MPDHDGARTQLAIPDYDHLPQGSVASRIRTLTAAELAGLIEYERGHANRVQILQAMNHRLDELHAGAEPSGGSPAATAPDAPAASQGRPTVTPATSGPPMNPPSQGDPTNPAQPRA